MTKIIMRIRSFLKLPLLVLVAPMILMAWAMICAGSRKEIRLRLRSARGGHILVTSNVVVDEEHAKAFHITA